MRYQKQESLTLIGQKQKILQKKTVAIVGIGAIGSNTANLLARAGLNLILIDRDVVELDNLQRQSIYDENDIGKPKASQIKDKLSVINSEIKIKAFVSDLNHGNINHLLKSDLILDCTDNLETRFLINDFAISNNIPWIFAAVLGVNGMLMNIVPGKTPCFSCIFQEQTSVTDNCDTVGIINSIPSLVASLQATEAIKILLDHDFSKGLTLFNIWDQEMQKLKTKRNLNCRCCGKNNYEYLDGKRAKTVLKFCGANSYQVKGKPLNLRKLYKKVAKISDASLSQHCLHTQSFTAFSDGRVLIKADSVNQAMSIYTKYID